jgi:glycerol-3-phosphate dehydrogenase (NAD(P)+)
MAEVAVLGAGSWGTALAIHLARNGHHVALWSHRAAQARTLQTERVNRLYLPEHPFPVNLRVTDKLAEAVGKRRELLIVVPSRAFAEVLEEIAPLTSDISGVAWATKGLESPSGRMLHQLAAAALGEAVPVAALSGPTFATEVAKQLPTAITVASRDIGFASRWADLLRNERFRAYTSDDLIGVQLGGATKNVLAIAAGISDGLGYGANARAALITRGLAEMMRLGLAMGGRPETFMGLSGVGDLVLTCTDNQSRNRRLGLGLGSGQSLETVKAQIGQEIEGVGTAEAVYRISCDLGVEMPITEQTYRVLYAGLPPAEAVKTLLTRDPKPENPLAAVTSSSKGP